MQHKFVPATRTAADGSCRPTNSSRCLTSSLSSCAALQRHAPWEATVDQRVTVVQYTEPMYESKCLTRLCCRCGRRIGLIPEDVKRTVETGNVKRGVFDKGLCTREQDVSRLGWAGKTRKTNLKPKRATDHTFNTDVTCEHGIVTLRVTEKLILVRTSTGPSFWAARISTMGPSTSNCRMTRSDFSKYKLLETTRSQRVEFSVTWLRKNLVLQIEQAARDQTDILVALATAQTQANMVADLSRWHMIPCNEVARCSSRPAQMMPWNKCDQTRRAIAWETLSTITGTASGNFETWGSKIASKLMNIFNGDFRNKASSMDDLR